MPVAPRRPKGPPLNALRAFEAAARLGSFATAAEELGVTPGAVSQHVKALEAWCGTTLFDRSAQGVALSAAGRVLTDEFTEAFDQLAAATLRLRNLAPSPEVHIVTLPSIAQLWLPPRLGRLRRMRPDLSVSVTAMETPPRLSRELFDLSIFFTEDDDAADRVVLATDIVFPVLAPKLARNADLAALPLLHDQTWHTDWADWARATGIDIGDPSRGPRYSLYALALEEAKAGAGALLGHACLVEQALAGGELIRLSVPHHATGRALTIELPHRSRRHPETDQVIRHLRDEA